MLDDAGAGHWLREQRERVSGRWQGPLGVPAGSVVICLGLGSSAVWLRVDVMALGAQSKTFSSERAVDTKCRSRPFGCGYD